MPEKYEGSERLLRAEDHSRKLGLLNFEAITFYTDHSPYFESNADYE